MSETCVKLIARMILSTMVGEQKRTWDLYEQYERETRLYVPVEEYVEWRRERQHDARNSNRTSKTSHQNMEREISTSQDGARGVGV